MKLAVLSILAVLASCDGGGGAPVGAACDDAGCAPDLECVLAPGGDARLCRTPATEVGSCCFGPADTGNGCAGSAEDVARTSLATDGCASALVCVADVVTGVDGAPHDPVCVHAVNRGAGERCNVGADECADGLVCAFADGTCQVHECASDDECSGGDVCVRGATEPCASSCGAAAEAGEACSADADESCGLTHSCASGLQCVDGTCASS